MSNISGKETRPEIMVRKYLFSHGFRYRKNVKELPGKPDIVLPKYKTIIFVHGCFWHGHKNCKKADLPESNRKLWNDKISGTKERDIIKEKQLKELGWNVLKIWQCELTPKAKMENTLTNLVKRIVPLSNH